MERGEASFPGLSLFRGSSQERLFACLSVTARILSVAECYDSAVSTRPHRAALSPEEALQMLRGGSGTLFDPEVARLFTAAAPTH